MKKIYHDSEQKYNYDNVQFTGKNESNISEQTDEENKGYVDLNSISQDSNEKKENEEYKEIDPKKRFKLFVIVIVALIFTVSIILVNAQLTKTRTSSVVDSLPSSDSTDDNNQEDPDAVYQSYLPTFSIYDSWVAEKNAFAIKFTKDYKFVYSERVGKKVYTYYGDYQVLYSDEAAISANLNTETACEIFHISEEDLNPSNLVFVRCIPTKYKIDNGAYKDISANEQENGDSLDLFTHLFYITDDLNGQVKITYYDEIEENTHVLIQSKNVPTTTKKTTTTTTSKNE